MVDPRAGMGGRIKRRYLWMCAYFYLCEIEEYEFDETRSMLKHCMNWQIEELAYKGYDGRYRNKRWFDRLMKLCD